MPVFFRIAVGLFFLAGAAAINSPAPAQVGPQLSVEQRREVFDFAWTQVSERFYDVRFRGVDWQVNGASIGIDLIRQFMQRTRRYEWGLMARRENVLQSVEVKDAILDALRRGDLDAACQAVRKNMEQGKEPILQWLRQREDESV